MQAEHPRRSNSVWLSYPGHMRFSLMTEPQVGGTYDQILAAARWAESNRLESFARSDHYYSGREPQPDATDALTTLAGLARDTTSIRLSVLVSPLTFRHPAVLAKTAATLDQMSGGRIDFGVGTGWMEIEHQVFGFPFPEWSERFDRLSEALGYLGAAFGGENARFSGKHYQLDANVGPVPEGLKLIVGGGGKTRTPRLAGLHADEYNHFAARPEEIGPKIEKMRSSASEAGRDPNAITVSVMGPAFVGRDESEYRAVLEHAATSRDVEPSAFEERIERAGLLHGYGDRLTGHLAALSGVGVEKYYFQWLNLDDLTGIDATYEALTTAASLL